MHYVWSGEYNEEGVIRLTTDPEPEQVKSKRKANKFKKLVNIDSAIIYGTTILLSGGYVALRKKSLWMHTRVTH